MSATPIAAPRPVWRRLIGFNMLGDALRDVLDPRLVVLQRVAKLFRAVRIRVVDAEDGGHAAALDKPRSLLARGAQEPGCGAGRIGARRVCRRRPGGRD